MIALSNNERSIIDALRRVFRAALFSSLGESAGEAVLFFLRERLGRDPFEVFWEDPGAVYHAMEKVFGAGAKVLVNLLLASINKEYNLNINSEYFLNLMTCGNKKSVEEIHFFLRKIAELFGREER